MDLIAEILARLPVKSILRFTCVCKSWNAVISDPQFVKKQLRSSATDPTRQHVVVALSSDSDPSPLNLRDYFLSSLKFTTPTYTQLILPCDEEDSSSASLAGSCHGILCLSIARTSPLLWNPSTRKFKHLPPLKWPDRAGINCGFGYDHLSDSYKVVAVFTVFSSEDDGYEHDVMLHTLGTDSWSRLSQKFLANNFAIETFARFVSGTLNWLCGYTSNNGAYGYLPAAIVSLDLGTETFQQLLIPDRIAADVDVGVATGVLKGCLCIIACHRSTKSAADVWVMKDYGIKESWTKLFSVPCEPQYHIDNLSVPKPLCMSDDDEILLKYELHLAVYNSKSGDETYHLILACGAIFSAVYPESLISPCI